MAITLAEAKVGMADKVDQMVVDEFRRSSLMLDNLTFDDSISPGTGGSTLTYGYTQLKTPSTAGVRAVNAEYTANEAKREKKTTEAIIMGGSFKVDRVLQNTSGAINEMAFQMQQKVIATSNTFHNLAINGTSASSGTGYATNTFDGIRKLLAGTSNEVSASSIDLSTSALMDSNGNAFLDLFDEFSAMIEGVPTMYLMNAKMLAKIRSIARRAGYLSATETAFGTKVERYGNVMLVDAGKYYNGSATVDVLPIDATKGTTSIVTAVFALDGFHGITPMGGKIISTALPDMNAPGAVKEGDVEFVAGVALKNTLKAGILNDIKIQATA